MPAKRTAKILLFIGVHIAHGWRVFQHDRGLDYPNLEDPFPPWSKTTGLGFVVLHSELN